MPLEHFNLPLTLQGIYFATPSRLTSVEIVTRLRDIGPRKRGSIPRQEICPFPVTSRQALGYHSDSYRMGTGSSWHGCKAAGREADHSLSSGVEVKYAGAMHPLPHTSSWPGN
jgi:hypothetical protein